MNLGPPTPMFGVSDIHKTVAFYRDALGCLIANTFEPEGRLAWACLNTGLGEVMLMQEGPEHINESAREARRDVILYFRPENVVALHESVRGKGFNCSDLRVAFYQMKEFDMEDPDGYQLWFGEETDEAPTVQEGKG